MMKFLIFNITVAAALIFLFTTDRSEVTATAGRIHDAASEVKDAAHRVVEDGRRWVDRTSKKVGDDVKDAAARAAEPLKKHEILKTTPMLPPTMAPEEGSGAKVPETVKKPVRDVAKTEEPPLNPASAPKPLTPEPRIAAQAAAPVAPKPPALPPVAAPVSLSPEQAAALKRREEILRGIDPKILIPTETEKAAAQPAAPSAAKTAEAPTMSPAERRKQLFALSEEMELIYARSLGQ
jgi:hypothetical protein